MVPQKVEQAVGLPQEPFFGPEDLPQLNLLMESRMWSTLTLE